jgi:Kdo2-lipid IVA lauroyltransferase/acyltransferase
VPKQRSAFRNRAEAVAFALVARGIQTLPRVRAEAFGRRLGLLFRRLSRRRRELVERNLLRAFPEASLEELRRLARGVFAHFGGLAFDLVASIGEPRESILGRVEVVGFERARRACASGRGVFFLTAHLGNWEMAAIVASLLDLPTHVVGRPLDNPLLETHLRSFREHGGNTVIPKATAARELIRVLRSGGAVGILMDQHARPPDAVAVPFFGRHASTTTAVARLADRTEALILPVTCLRAGPARYRLECHEVVDPRNLSPEERETATFTARLNGIIESLVRTAPEQWLWLHDRWRLD